MPADLFSQSGALKIFEIFFHPSAFQNDYVRKRHQSFIYSHLIGAALALALFPFYLLRVDEVSTSDLAILLLFMTPFLTVAILRWRGVLAEAYLISALNFAIFITIGAAYTGGVTSFLLAWLVIVPLEAALSGRKSVIGVAIAAAALSLASLYMAGNLGWLPEARQLPFPLEMLALFGLFTATVYGGTIAMAVQRIHEESENHVRQSEMKYRLMADNATDMISVHDARGATIFASPAATSLIGVAEASLYQGGLFERIHVSDRPLYMTALSNCLNGKGPVRVEFRVKCVPEDGDAAETASGFHNEGQGSEYKWLEMRCRAVKEGIDNNGEMQIVAVTRDICAHKTQEITLLKARDEAETANVAKTRFLANMSHELRTPLNAIIGFSDVLNMELEEKHKNIQHADYARLINEAGEHLLSVVNNILDMSKIEVGKFTITPEPFLLLPLLTSSCAMIGPAAKEKQVSIEMQFEDIVDYLYADSRALKQMLLNLLSNAVKFSHEGGSVAVRSYTNDVSLFIEVEDQGVGISEEDLPKLCNPFVQADSSYKRQHEGVGLGLSVVKGLAQLHGGSLTINSSLGAGTTARLEMPLRMPQNLPLDEPGETRPSAKGAIVLFNRDKRKKAQA